MKSLQKVLLTTLFILCFSCVQALNFTSVQDGNWNDPCTWNLACTPGIPSASDVVIINHDVNLNVDVNFNSGQLVVNGTLSGTSNLGFIKTSSAVNPCNPTTANMIINGSIEVGNLIMTKSCGIVANGARLTTFVNLSLFNNATLIINGDVLVFGNWNMDNGNVDTDGDGYIEVYGCVNAQPNNNLTDASVKYCIRGMGGCTSNPSSPNSYPKADCSYSILELESDTIHFVPMDNVTDEDLRDPIAVRLYTLNGIEVKDNKNLPQGIYILTQVFQDRVRITKIIIE